MPLEFTHVTTAGPLVPLAEMKAYLRITDTAQDTDLTAIMDAAQQAILSYLTAGADAAWTPTTAPTPVKQAIKLLTTNYYEHRGDDMNPAMAGSNPDSEVWMALGRLLCMYRDPTLA